MVTERASYIQVKIAKIISFIFNPLFIPLYSLIFIFTAPTLFLYLPFKVKKILFLIVLANNVIIPVSLMPFFKYKNIISSWNIESRDERAIPLLSVTFLYSVTSFIMFRLPIPVFVQTFFLSTSILSLVVLVINQWWKISIHSVGAGALTAIIFTLSVKMSVLLIWFLIPAILISGLILSSRLKLNSQDPSRVYLGFLTGFAEMSFFMLFF